MLLQRLTVCVLATVFADPTAVNEAGLPVENPPEVVERLQTHYRAALDELSAADISHLSAAQRSGRAQALAELRAYCERGVFGVNRDPRSARQACFVDGGGRLCAVANLMAAAGERALVDEVAATANHAYVVELASVPALVAWLDSVGLSVEEAARIQAPSSHANPPTTGSTIGTSSASGGMPSASGSGPSSGGKSSSSSSPWGAGARPGGSVISSGPQSGGSTGSVTSAAPDDKRGGRTTSRGQPDRNGSMRSGAVWTPDGSEDGWWLWWEMNKLRFLTPNRLAARSDTGSPAVTHGNDAARGLSRTGMGRDARFGSGVGSNTASDARLELLPLLTSLTQAEDATLRARAAVTLGRLGGRDAVAPLTALLSDNQMIVRHAAILGLGATGAMEAAPTLLHLATDGTLPGDNGSQLSSWARPLALVSLGLGRRHGMSAVLDGFVAELASAETAERPELGTAALLYQDLAPSEALSAFMLATVDDEQAEPGLRCRATEALGQLGDAAQLSRLTHLLGAGQIEERRSAALALSGFEHPLALAALKTAYELESEPVARGFLLLSVAEQGGQGARDFLVRAARGGAQSARPWAALGLGLMARGMADRGELAEQPAYAEVCAVLREGLGSEANHSARGAWILASGIARDAGSAARLRDVMVGSKDQRVRMFASLSLAMIGDAESRPLMLEQLRHEDAPLAIVGLTQALGAFGVADDGPALVAAVNEMRVPATQALLAIALAFHGSESAVFGLMQIARDDQATAPARAAAVDGLGLLLDDQPGLMLQEVAAASNFYVFPDWVNGMLTTFTL